MLLKVGSKNDNVKAIQAKLGLTVDGVFGAGTAKAVKDWQVAHGLAADGLVGDATWSKMFAVIVARNESGLLVDDDGNTVEINSADDKPAAASVNVAAPVVSVPSLNLDKLKGHIPDAVIAQIPEAAAKFQINTAVRLAHFLAQCGHESAGFKAIQENLNYSADGLNKIFTKYFKTVNAADYARQPEKIASRVYADRMGNGNEASKEGYKYRGRGYIQLTGKANYAEFDKTVDEDLISNPDLVASKYPLLSAAWYWNSRSLNNSADKGANDAAVTEITKKVNGGTIGLADRIKHFKEYYALLA
ncbi:MAG: peptidoglycan-binding protein [Methylococcales bacterium]|nr:peptidoglycan-binding protein [Methylococcales bacterium]